MRRDPRTGTMMLEPGDEGYDPTASDGGYFKYQMGIHDASRARLENIQGALGRAREKTQQARSAQQDQAFEEIMAQPTSESSYDRARAMGRFVSEFDVAPGGDDLDFFPAQPA